ncbi:alpha/beta fold hydrolase, partial [Deinococcus sp. 23YEL01]|uniref:alpha/beta fold hydrolase n=1 Tax=Deinococcus sp. 23YEL01 TaxID=2745871 RepID=UPI001E33ADB4
IDTLADAVTDFLRVTGLTGTDVVGHSMGGRLAMELRRRGVVGAVVALGPGGFQAGWEKPFFYGTAEVSVALIRLFRPLMPWLTRSRVGRTLLFAQYSTRPWEVPADVAMAEMQSYAASPSVRELMKRLILRGGDVRGGDVNARAGSVSDAPRPLVIAWGHYDRVCLPRQAWRALELFPQARLHWFGQSGHCPQWDSPAETVRLILGATGEVGSVPAA